MQGPLPQTAHPAADNYGDLLPCPSRRGAQLTLPIKYSHCVLDCDAFPKVQVLAHTLLDQGVPNLLLGFLAPVERATNVCVSGRPALVPRPISLFLRPSTLLPAAPNVL